jgi:Bacteriophytochrome (light-regulated signal transduction histidine kinase)
MTDAHTPRPAMGTVSEADGPEARLRALIAQQEAFSHGVSHDLRGPLRMIEHAAANALEAIKAGRDEEAAAGLSRIREATARMGALMEAMQEYMRIGRTAFAPQALDLSLLADWATMDLDARHPRLDLRVEVQPGMRAYGDEALLRRLFDLLLDNARRFAEPSRGVEIRVEADAQPDGVVVRVSDRGIGMELRRGVDPFAPFQRLHSVRQGAGDGLGLAIARAIVERHGGCIHAQSMPGEGTVIVVGLPAASGDGPRPL